MGVGYTINIMFRGKIKQLKISIQNSIINIKIHYCKIVSLNQFNTKSSFKSKNSKKISQKYIENLLEDAGF